MSDYTVEWNEHDQKWCVMDVGMKFDCFDTEEEANHEKHLLDKTVTIEGEIEEIGSEYTDEELRYFMNAYGVYGLGSIWGLSRR